MQFVELNGIVLHYRSRGDRGRPALVFSNSLGTDLRIWDRVAPAFENQFHVVCYDKRGHGLSDAPPAPYRLEDHVDDLVGLIEALQIVDAVVCGDSVGGLIAQAVASRCPDVVRALVLSDTAAKIGDAPTWNARIEAVEKGGIEAVADATLERWFTRSFRAERTAELAGWRNMLVRTPLAGYLGTMAAVRDADQTEDTDGLSVPALVVVGNEDGSTPPHVVKGLSDLLDESEFHVISNAGHLPCIDQPETLVELMRDFLRRNGLMA
jgi:3-oxoadipate enol-lactonase